MGWLKGIGLLSAVQSTPVQLSDFQAVFDGLTGQISVVNVIAVIAGVIGVCVGLVFMWWGVRKIVGMLMSAFRKGKVSV